MILGLKNVGFVGNLAKPSGAEWVYIGDSSSDPGADVNVSDEYATIQDAKNHLESVYPAASNLGLIGAAFNLLTDIYHEFES